MEYVIGSFLKRENGKSTILCYEKDGDTLKVNAHHFKSLREASGFFWDIIGTEVLKIERAQITILSNSQYASDIENPFNTEIRLRKFELSNGVSANLCVQYKNNRFVLLYEFTVGLARFFHEFQVASPKIGVELIQSLTEDDMLEVYKVLAKGLVEVIPNTL
jgi:hypothetical protein